jgi:nicotinamidase-related amidase
MIDTVTHIWEDLLTEQDQAVIQQAGYKTRGATLWDSRSLGNKPALLIIDMQQMLIGRNAPILEAIEDYPTAMGAIAWQALEYIVPFVAVARKAKIPIFYTRVVPEGRTAGDPDVKIVEPLAPEPDDRVIDKNFTSVFYDTPLLTHLIREQVDTLVIVGNSTSGCIRAAAVDARQLGFHPLIPVECVFDRVQASHRIALLDMWMKYAAVMPVEEAHRYIAQVTDSNHGD